MEPQIFSVSAITELLKEVIEATFSHITIEGEISNFRPSKAGHWYFTLKDDNASISAVMFKFKTFTVSKMPADGQKVRAHGRLSVYEARGTYQIICEQLEPVGTGDILQMLEQRKQRLLAEGLFDASSKKPIPMLPKHIGVITSPTGAALRDILSVLSRRNAQLRVTVLPVTVQGNKSADEIASMIEYANLWGIGDVLILSRGGGSIEDLLPFSEESVVRAVHASKIPLITAVGHETDWSLSDYAADLRAPTPSAAAELVTAEQHALDQKVQQHTEQIIYQINRELRDLRGRKNQLSAERLAEPLLHRITTGRMHADELRESMINIMQGNMQEKKHRLQLLSSELHSASPKAILERGYAVLTSPQTGKTIRSVKEVGQGTQIRASMHDGSFYAHVDATDTQGAEDEKL
jgi:exodeoxyribonuclease VII large subunit